MNDNGRTIGNGSSTPSSMGAQVNVTEHENDEATSVVPFDC